MIYGYIVTVSWDQVSQLVPGGRKEGATAHLRNIRKNGAAPYSHVDTPVPVRSLKLSNVGSG